MDRQNYNDKKRNKNKINIITLTIIAKTDCIEKYGKSLFNGGRIWEDDQPNPNKSLSVFSFFDSSLSYLWRFVASP